jgi:hypothetical protein
MSILGSAIDIVDKIVCYFSNKQLIDAGKSEAVVQGLENESNALKDAQNAKNAVDNQLVRDPSSLRADDGFKRSD